MITWIVHHLVLVYLCACSVAVMAVWLAGCFR